MKVAHINCVYEAGSTGKLIQEIVEACRESGIESKVFYSEGKSQKEEAVRYISNFERNLHAILSRCTGLQGYWSRNATKRLIQYLKAYNPDVIHLHNLHGNCINLPMLFAYLEKCEIPVVVTLHDCWWFTGKCSHPTSHNCGKWSIAGKENPCMECANRGDVCPTWFFDRASYMITDKKRMFETLKNVQVICVSDWLEQLVKQSYVFENIPNIGRIYNWIDTDVYRKLDGNENSKSTNRKKRILGVASIFLENKGIDDFIWLSEHLPETYEIVLVGNLLKKTILPNSIVHIGNITSKDTLVSLYNQADVFVNPSQYETFGLTTVEAMACGTPVVAYNFSTAEEIIGDSCGIIVPMGDKKRLLKAVVEVCNQGKKAYSCAEWAADRFAKKNGTTKYVESYQNICRNMRDE